MLCGSWLDLQASSRLLKSTTLLVCVYLNDYAAIREGRELVATFEFECHLLSHAMNRGNPHTVVGQ